MRKRATRAPAARKPIAAAGPPPMPRKRIIAISQTALEKSRQQPRAVSAALFSLPSFPPAALAGVPKSAQMAADEAIGGVTSWANMGWGAITGAAFAEGVAFLGYTYLAELAQRPEYRVISETIATEMTRKWIKITAKGDEDKSEKIGELNEELDRLKVRDHFCRACEIDGFFGRAHLYLDTGQTDDREELKTPIGDGRNDISRKKVGKGDLKRLAVVEPVWCYPSSYNSNDPLKPDWYNPQSWFVQGKEVHASRILRFVAREVPDILKPAYAFGGLALSQMAKPYVDNWLNVRQSVSDIIRMFSVFVLATDMGESLSPGGDELFTRADLFNNLRNNRGLMIMDKEGEDFKNVAAPLGSLDALQAQAQEHMAAVSRIPLVKLLGISPHGLNASSEGEIRVFYDSIAALQGRFFAPNLRRVIAFAQLNIWGAVDPDIEFVFEPLWSLDEKEQAEVRKGEAETDQVLIDSGVLTPAEARQRIAKDPDTPYQGLDPDEVPDLREEEEEGLEPKGSAEHLADAGDDGETREAA